MSTSIRILRNTSYLYIKMAVTLFISLYTTRLILNSLGESDFGIFNVVGGAIAMLGFINAAMASASQRFLSYTEGEGNLDKKRIIFNMSLVLNVVISFIVLLLLLIASLFFFNGVLNIPPERMFAAKVIYGCLIVSTILTVMNVPYDAIMNAHENMLYFSIIGIFESMLKLAVAFVCVYTSFDKLIAYGVLMACIPMVTLTIMKVYCHKKYEECIVAPRRYYNRGIMKEMMSFAGWNFFSTFATLISGHGSNIVLNHFFGSPINAANGIMGQINGQLQVFGNSLLKAVNPVLVKSEGAHNRDKMFKYAFTGAKLTVCMYAYLAVPFVVDRDYILSLWLKSVPPYTSDFVKYLLIWTFFSQIAGTLATSISAIGNIKRMSQWCSFVLILNIFILYFAFKIGANPEAFMVFACLTGAFQTSIYIYYGWKLGGMNLRRYFFDVFVRVALSIIFAYITIYSIWQQMTVGIVRLFVLCVFSVVLYSIFFYCIALNTEERGMINNFTLKAKKIIINHHSNEKQ